MDFEFKDSYNVSDLLKIITLLRSENGCPWDRVQTHESIRMNFIEETYEVCEAIDKRDNEMLKEELGDVLLQIVFHCEMEREKQCFNFDDVADGICKKLIHRHPHVFGDVKVNGVGDVLDNWNEIKKQEKGQNDASSTLDAVPLQFPALMRAQKVQKRASKAGMDYENADGALSDLKSELSELTEAVDNASVEEISDELGDLIFSAVNVARMFELDSEQVLTRATEKFISRFKKAEQTAKDEGIDMKTADAQTLDFLWKRAKQ